LPSGVRGPGLLSGGIRHAWIVSARRLGVALRLRAPDLRREVTEQCQLLHHPEIVGRGLGGDRGRGADITDRRRLLCEKRFGLFDRRGSARFAFLVLLAIDDIQQCEPLLRSRV